MAQEDNTFVTIRRTVPAALQRKTPGAATRPGWGSGRHPGMRRGGQRQLTMISGPIVALGSTVEIHGT